MLGRPAFEIDSLDITVDQYFDELKMLEGDEWIGPLHTTLQSDGNLLCTFDNWEQEECKVEQQEIALAYNIDKTREFYEGSVLIQGGFPAPRDSFNRWIIRTVNNQFDNTEFLADENLVEEVVTASPSPFLWVQDKRQLFNHIQTYGIAIKQSRDRGWINRREYSTIMNSLADMKNLLFEDKLEKLKVLRKTVSELIRPKVLNWLLPVVARMRILVFEARRPGICDISVGSVILGLYKHGKPDSNYLLYQSFMGNKGKGYQIRVAQEIYNLFDEGDVEGFASPLNRVKARYCSLFGGDRRFGAIGSFYSSWSEKECYLLNPPFMDDIIVDLFGRLKEAKCVILFLAATDTNLCHVRDRQLQYMVVDKSQFPYEQLFEKKSPPGVPVKFYFVEHTLIVWWGRDTQCVSDRVGRLKQRFPS